MTTPNTILLDGCLGRQYDEALVQTGQSITPGMLIERVSGKVQPHSSRGGKARRLFAVEEGLIGLPIDTAYAAGEFCRFVEPADGNRVYALLHAGENVTKDDWLISYGDGTLAKLASAFLANTVAASSAVSNTTTETAFSNGTVTIPKNTLKVGDTIRVRAQGIATATNSTDTLTVKLKLGSTVVVTTGAVDVADNDIFVIEAWLTIRTIGASGTFVASGAVSLGASGTVTRKAVFLASTAIDTTADNTLTVTATWSAASSSNSVRMDALTIEQVKSSTTTAGAADSTEGIVAQALETVDNSAGTDPARIRVALAP